MRLAGHGDHRLYKMVTFSLPVGYHSCCPAMQFKKHTHGVEKPEPIAFKVLAKGLSLYGNRFT